MTNARCFTGRHAACFAEGDLHRSRAVVARAVVALVLFPFALALGPDPSSHDGLLVLHNGSRDRVKVEVRIGPSKNCTTDDAFATVVLGPDEWWSFITPDVICWRRERAPDPSAGGQSAASWTDWQPTQVPADTKQEVEL